MSARPNIEISLAKAERRTRRIKRQMQFMDTIPVPSEPVADITHEAEFFLHLLLLTVVGLLLLFVMGVIYFAEKVH